MIQSGQEPRLARKLPAQTAIGRERFLQRHCNIQPPIHGFVNCAHAATTQTSDDAVTVLQNGSPWQKRRTGCGVQRLLHFPIWLATSNPLLAGKDWFHQQRGHPLKYRTLEESKYDFCGQTILQPAEQYKFLRAPSNARAGPAYGRNFLPGSS
jgi:hypothetical protein